MHPILKSHVVSGICSLVTLFFFSLNTQGQTTVRGIITDANNTTPLAAATVVLEHRDGSIYKGVATDENGLYVFNGVREGRYGFKVTYIGYTPYEDSLVVNWTDEILVKSVALEPSGEQLEDLVITRRGRDADLDVGQEKIGRVELSRVPTPAGGGDLASYIQTLPGVVSTGDRGGNLFIRGGTPTENLSLIDGALVYQPFHIIGFFSVFPEDVVSEADFYAGGFSPRFNGRTSSVLDVKLKNGDLYDRKWSASVSPFIGELYLESPVNEGESAVIFSARNSLIESSSELYGNIQPLEFNSQLFKWNKAISEDGSTCSTIILRSKDEGKLDYERGDIFRWNNFVIGGKCAVLASEGNVPFFDINLSVSHITNEVGQEDDPERTSSATIFNTQFNMVQVFTRFRLEYGFYTNLRWLNHDIKDYFIDFQTDEKALLGSGGYIQSIIPLGSNIEVRPGVSASWYLFRYKMSIEPRLQLSYKPRGLKNEELSLAGGVYRQPTSGINDFRDAGTAFTVWSTSPYGGDQMTSYHAMAGWRQPLGERFDYSIEGYYKWTRDLPVSTWSSIAQFNTNISLANGESRGMDFKLNYDGDVFYSSVGYGYGITQYSTAQDLFGTWFGEPVQEYHPPHDRRHQVNVQAGLDFELFDVNLSWQYGSGLPYTRPLGFDDLIRFGDQLPDVRNDPGTPRVILDRPFNGRTPPFHRLNVSMEKAFDFNPVQMKIQVGAINAYNQQNLFYYDVYTQRRIDQLSFFPYVSMKLQKD